MYEDLMGMDGLGAISLESLKKDGVNYLTLGATAVASIAAAKWVTGKVADMSWAKSSAPGAPPATTKSDGAGAGIDPAGLSLLGKVAVIGTPIVAGTVIGLYGRGMTESGSLARAASDGVAIGMVAYGVAALAANFLEAKSIPLSGLGQSKSDLSISHYLGQAPSRIETSMRGLGQDPFSARAQLQSMGFRGLGQAPARVESVRGLGQAPSQVEVEQRALAGLAATLM